MLGHFSKAVEQLNDPSFRKVFWRGVIGALVAFALAFFLADYLLGLFASYDFGRFDDQIDWLLEWAIVPAMLVASYFLFPGVATGIMSIFIDDVVDAVEAKYYPDDAAPRRLGMMEGAYLGLRMAVLVVLWNLLALPFYVILMFTAIGPFVLFLALNGYLLGREYLETVALRHMPAKAAARYRKAHRGDLFALGLGTTVLFMIPIVNLFAPLIGAAMAVHFFHAAIKPQERMRTAS